MLEKFIFENHLGQRFEGLPNGVYLNYNDLRDYSWSYDTINNRISRFYMETTSRTLPLVVNGKTDEEAIAVKNRLLELAETDIVARVPGKIRIGEFYTKGYITGSKKSNYLISKRLCNIELTFTSDDPAWYKEQNYVFMPGDYKETTLDGGTDYPYDYPYDYAVAMTGRRIICDTVGSNAFRLLIYGQAVNPSVVIGGHTYAINGAIGKGETVLIDSLAKTITHSTAAGKKTNWFNQRSRESYIFEPIPAGWNTVAYSGSFGFDLTIIEKRSEPRWT